MKKKVLIIYSGFFHVIMLMLLSIYPILRFVQGRYYSKDTMFDIAICVLYGSFLFSTFFLYVLILIIWFNKHDNRFNKEFGAGNPFRYSQLYGIKRRIIFIIISISGLSELFLLIKRTIIHFNFSGNFFIAPVIVYILFFGSTALATGLHLRLKELIESR